MSIELIMMIKFQACVRGVPSKKIFTCTDGFHFDPKTRTCNFAERRDPPCKKGAAPILTKHEEEL